MLKCVIKLKVFRDFWFKYYYCCYCCCRYWLFSRRFLKFVLSLFASMLDDCGALAGITSSLVCARARVRHNIVNCNYDIRETRSLVFEKHITVGFSNWKKILRRLLPTISWSLTVESAAQTVTENTACSVKRPRPFESPPRRSPRWTVVDCSSNNSRRSVAVGDSVVYSVRVIGFSSVSPNRSFFFFYIIRKFRFCSYTVHTTSACLTTL